ncbi:MAG: transporter [Rikenellaceae bacterium]
MRILDAILTNLRPFMMLTAMSAGILLYRPISYVDDLAHNQIAPALIFLMLFVTFCKVHLRDLRFTKLQLWLILFQLIAAPASYYLFLPFGDLMAQGAMICFLAPIAMGAVAIGALLGANISTLASYSLVCNLTMAFIAPYYLDMFGNGECTFAQILSRVVPLLLSPLIAAQLLKRLWAAAARWISDHSQMSFYMWLFSMFITLSRTTNYIVETRADIALSTGMGLALVALIACLAQYAAGRVIGNKCGDKVAGAQSLGQKNTVLAVWLAQTFLFPVSSIAPTAYIIWQNLVNSYQIYRHDRLLANQKPLK